MRTLLRGIPLALLALASILVIGEVLYLSHQSWFQRNQTSELCGSPTIAIQENYQRP
jgi:hypothetical protein